MMPGRVRMDSLRAGTRFRDVRGTLWEHGGKVGGSSGAYNAFRISDGFRDCFAGCAEVTIETKED